MRMFASKKLGTAYPTRPVHVAVPSRHDARTRSSDSIRLKNTDYPGFKQRCSHTSSAAPAPAAACLSFRPAGRRAAAATAAAPHPPSFTQHHPQHGSEQTRAADADSELDARLRRWLRDHGGFVHDSISITSATQCGSRGLAASAPISLAQLEAGSLVVVPRELHLDNRAALAAIGPRLGSSSRQDAFAALGQLQQVACYLAAERAKGSDSFWLPYLLTLPAQPPNPWLLTGHCLAEVLEAAAEAGRLEAELAAAAAASGEAGRLADELEEIAAGIWDGEGVREDGDREIEAAAGWAAGPGGDRSGWAAAVEVARRRYGRLADEALEVVGPDRGGLCLDREGVLWALGQVVSRSLGCGASSGLLPFIDMANHDSAARPPMMMLDDSDRLVFAVTSIREGELAPLEAGQELFISYQAESFTPLQAWLKWGFVPHCLPPRSH